MMSQEAETVLTPYLGAEESLLWCGQPRRGIRLQLQDLFLIPFSLLWGGFAIFWEVMALRTTASHHGFAGALFPLFGLPFVCVGLYLIVGRFFADARIRARTFYGVTNQRILILSGFFSRELKSLPLHSLPELSLTQRANGSGRIVFGRSALIDFPPSAEGWPQSRRYAPPSFDLIDNPKEVYDIIVQAQKREIGNAAAPVSHPSW